MQRAPRQELLQASRFPSLVPAAADRIIIRERPRRSLHAATLVRVSHTGSIPMTTLEPPFRSPFLLFHHPQDVREALYFCKNVVRVC